MASIEKELADLAERERAAEAMWSSGPRRFETGLGEDVHVGNRNFYGEKSRSLQQGCHESEVPLLKKIVGPALESCVCRDGSVKFQNRQQERAYAAAMAEARVRNAANPGCFLSEKQQARDRERALKRAAQSVAG